MDPQLQSLRFWHDLITIYALLLSIEGPVLLWVGTYRERPWRERWLAFVPVLAFGWGAWSAKLVNDQAINAASALLWGREHYPTFPVTVDAGAAVEAATRTGWIFGAVATLLLIGGWVLMLRWSRGKGLPAWRPRRSEGPAGFEQPPGQAIPLASALPITGTLDDADDEGIEITVEPLEK